MPVNFVVYFLLSFFLCQARAQVKLDENTPKHFRVYELTNDKLFFKEEEQKKLGDNLIKLDLSHPISSDVLQESIFQQSYSLKRQAYKSFQECMDKFNRLDRSQLDSLYDAYKISDQCKNKFYDYDESKINKIGKYGGGVSSHFLKQKQTINEKNLAFYDRAFREDEVEKKSDVYEFYKDEKKIEPSIFPDVEKQMLDVTSVLIKLNESSSFKEHVDKSKSEAIALPSLIALKALLEKSAPVKCLSGWYGESYLHKKISRNSSAPTTPLALFFKLDKKKVNKIESFYYENEEGRFFLFKDTRFHGVNQKWLVVHEAKDGSLDYDHYSVEVGEDDIQSKNFSRSLGLFSLGEFSRYKVQPKFSRSFRVDISPSAKLEKERLPGFGELVYPSGDLKIMNMKYLRTGDNIYQSTLVSIDQDSIDMTNVLGTHKNSHFQMSNRAVFKPLESKFKNETSVKLYRLSIDYSVDEKGRDNAGVRYHTNKAYFGASSNLSNNISIGAGGRINNKSAGKAGVIYGPNGPQYSLGYVLMLGD